MQLTNVLLKKVKTKYVLVAIQSLASGHIYMHSKERIAEKVEVIRFDPWVQQCVLYKEIKRVCSIRFRTHD